MKNLKTLLEKSNYNDFEFAKEFNQIILNKVTGNYGKNKAALKSFLEDLQHGGCISGMIGDFVYHADCKDFYIRHIEELEQFKTDLEDNLGEAIKNRHNLVHYTFVVWLVFEEYCYDLYSTIFEQ